MLNIEKYKDEIKAELEKNKTLGCVVNKLMGNTCDDYPKCNDCYLKVLDWLLQECKEPILTDKEKAYLKNVIEPKKDDITWIRKWCFYKGTESEYTAVTVYEKHPTLTSLNSLCALLFFIVNEEMSFKGMEVGKTYTLEELGL